MKFRFNDKRSGRTIAFSDIISDVTSEMGLSEDFFLENIRMAWSGAAGEIIATHSYPYRIINHVLYISVDHPIYANEIALSQSMIIQKLGDSCGSKKISSIKCTMKKKHKRN